MQCLASGCAVTLTARILVYWYTNQSMRVRWGNSVSAPFSVGNGVRQGGILSPALFNNLGNLDVYLVSCRQRQLFLTR